VFVFLGRKQEYESRGRFSQEKRLSRLKVLMGFEEKDSNRKQWAPLPGKTPVFGDSAPGNRQ